MKNILFQVSFLIVLIIGLLNDASAQELVKWVEYPGSLPTNVVYGGQENGVKLAICRCEYNGVKHAGKVVAGKCNFGWGGMEVTRAAFEVLINPFNTELAWVVPTTPMSINAVVSGFEDGENMFVGKANYANGVHPGKVRWNGERFVCEIGYGGKEVQLTDFKVLVTGTPYPPSQESAATGCLTAIGHWNVNGGYMSLKEDGMMTVFKGAPFGTWKCVENNVRLIYSNGEKQTLTLNADGTMSGMNGDTPFTVKPMTKEEKEMMKTAQQVDDALNTIFKKKN